MGKADVVYKGMGGNCALINLGKKTMTGTARMGVLDMVEGAGITPRVGDMVVAMEDGEPLGNASTCLSQDGGSGTWIMLDGSSTRYQFPVVHGRFSATVAFDIFYVRLREG